MDDQARELRQYVLALVWALFNDDKAEGVLDRLPAAPSAVTDVTPRPHRWDPNRIAGFDVAGSFNTSAMMAMDFSGGRYEDRYDIVTAYVTPDDLPEHLGARVSAQGQPGMRVDSICVEAETLKNPPTPPSTPETSPTTASSPVPAVGEPIAAPEDQVSADQTPLEPAIGGVESVPPFDLAGLINDRWHRQIQVMRDFEQFTTIATFLAADPSEIHFGLPPSYQPIIRLGVDGMTIGFMVDAPELGFVDERACLYEFSSGGITLSDSRITIPVVIRESVTERRSHIEESGDVAELEAWLEAATQFSQQMGWKHFSPTGMSGFAWGDKRRKPVGSPKNTKWRTDAGGNGVLARLSNWGEQPIRKPRSIESALEQATSRREAGAPAHALHLLREALVIANSTNDATAAVVIYRAMVEPLNRLGRSTAAARSEALGALGTS